MSDIPGTRSRPRSETGREFGATVTYITQDAPLGIAHGVKISEPFIGGEPFTLFLGDNFIRDGISPLVEKFKANGSNSQILLYEVPNPQDFGVAELENGRVIQVVEKPNHPKTNLALVGIYMFDGHVFEAVNNIEPSARGELGDHRRDPISDQQWAARGSEHRQGALDRHRQEGRYAGGQPSDSGDFRIKLKLGLVDEQSEVHGRVVIEEHAEIVNSVVRGPAIIGEHSRIENSYIGPFTSVYHHCLVSDSEIEHSIVLEHSRIVDIPYRIEDSLIGRNVELTRSSSKPKGYKLMLGDNSRVGVVGE